jgi:hypothetical protein
MDSGSLGWNLPLSKVVLSGAEGLPKSALMSAFIFVRSRSAFAAALCNADHTDNKIFTSNTYSRLHGKESIHILPCIQAREKVRKLGKI